jgi:hypothetical protein
MKKGLLFFWLAAAATGWALEWQLPVVTLKGEASGGSLESYEDEGVLEPSSRRGTATLTIRESADPLDLAWVFRWSAKDWLTQAGDYTYLEAGQEARFAVSKGLKLSGEAGVKRMEHPEGAVPSTDWTAIRAKLGADLAVVRGTTVEVGLDGRWEVHDDPAESRQRWTGSAAVTTRFGGWLLDARWRGEFRFPLGGATGVEASTLHTGSVSFRWDPNP